MREYFSIQSNYILFVLAGNDDPGKQVQKSIDISQFNGYQIDNVEILLTKDSVDLLKESDEYKIILQKKIQHNFIFLETFDLEKNQKIIEQLILNYVDKKNIITDITGGTKIMTLALFIEAQKFNLLPIYLPINESRIIKLA